MQCHYTAVCWQWPGGKETLYFLLQLPILPQAYQMLSDSLSLPFLPDKLPQRLKPLFSISLRDAIAPSSFYTRRDVLTGLQMFLKIAAGNIAKSQSLRKGDKRWRTERKKMLQNSLLLPFFFLKVPKLLSFLRKMTFSKKRKCISLRKHIAIKKPKPGDAQQI